MFCGSVVETYIRQNPPIRPNPNHYTRSLETRFMARMGFIRGAACWLACIAMLWAPSAQGQAPPSVAPVGVDLALAEGGVLKGTVVDSAGAPRAGARVVLMQRQLVVAEAVADEEGQFVFENLRGGSYVLICGSDALACRLWAPNTAPPQARDRVLLTSSSAVRGHGLRYWLANPWFIAGVAATSIGVPIIVHNARQDRSRQTPN